MTKAIKISEENYKWLSKLAGSLQAEIGAKVSIDGAITHLKKGKKSIMDLAGSWTLNEKETKDMMQSLRKGWKGWSTKSA